MSASTTTAGPVSAAHDVAFAVEQVVEQSERPGRERDHHVATPDRVRGGIEPHVASGEHGRAGVGRATSERAHPGRQLREVERLGQVVVRSGIEATDLVRQRVARREHEHARGRAGGAQLAAQLEAVAVGQADVEHDQAVQRKHQLLRTNALGNFRTLVQQLTVDAAMLGWLDGDGSVAEAPNENYAREMLELFTLGADAGYTEADVHSGAIALAGWHVDDKTEKVSYEAEDGPTGAVPFLGRTVSEAAAVVDAAVDHEACAPFIAAKLYGYFHGVAPDAPTLGALATQFRSSNLGIAPLVAAILRDAAFFDQRNNRARFPIEWYVAANAVLGVTDHDYDVLEQLGQEPFSPPNVAGWPAGPRWHSASAALARAAYAWEAAGDSEVVSRTDPIGAVLAKASIEEPTNETVAALRQAVAAVEGRRDRASVLPRSSSPAQSSAAPEKGASP